MKDAKYAVVAWALNLHAHNGVCTYSEGPNRYANLNRRGVLPFVGDCSSTLRDYFNWAGAPDPYKLGYNVPEGYTGTELSAGTHIEPLVRNGRGVLVEEVRPGDAVVYGPGTGWHTALVVMVRGTDILTVSMGRQGDPSFVWVNPPAGPSLGYGVDGREPQTFLRFDTMAPRVYWPRGYCAGPLFSQVRYAGLRRATPAVREVATRNGWTVFGWGGSWFVPEANAVTLSDARWVSRRYATRRGA